MQAILALEDGRVFRGKGYGAKGECYGEVVFNTSITGYQEIFTDPSYAGQIVVLTNPQIGNYGTNAEDNEATRPYIEGLIVREFSKVSSNWRSQQVAEEYLEQFKIPVLAEIDTRCVKAMVCGDCRKRTRTARPFWKGRVNIVVTVCKAPSCDGAEEA